MASASERLYVARSGSSATNTTAVATVAATAKTIVAVLGGSGDSICVKRIKVSFASVTATDVPAVVEIGLITALGTSTSFTPVQHSGTVQASSSTAGYNHSVEPTYSRILDSFYAPVNNGLVIDWSPLGEEALAAGSQGWGIRVTSPQAQSVLASILYSE